MQKKENHARIIFHIDMNAFFCSVACILYPHLRGKAFAIGRENTTRGVISTASYEARKLGIHSGQPLSEAFSIYPELIVVHIDYHIYGEYSNKFIHIVKSYSDLVEVASIDECYADMTEISKTRHPIVVAKEIQERLLNEHNLTCSIGIAPTLFLAKMASDIKKPLGLTVIRKRDALEILSPLSVSDIFGIGKKTWPRLVDNGIKTIGDFMNPDNKNKIIELVGSNTYDYATSHILGNSSNVVMPNRYDNSSSISTSATYDVYKTSVSEILYELRIMTRDVISKMIKSNYLTNTVTITLRDSSFKTITRQKKLDYTDDFNDIFEVVVDLLDDNFIDGTEYRLVGVGLSNLVDKKDLPKEYNLFTVSDMKERDIILDDLISDFQHKYGKDIIFKNKDKK